MLNLNMQHKIVTTNEDNTQQKVLRIFFFVVGSISLALGVIGIILPVLPTTPFLLLALACYYRSSKRMTNWMLNNKYFGTYIRRYKEGKGIPLKTKMLAITILWIAIIYSAIFIVPIWIAQIILLGVAIAVTLHLIWLPTYHN